MADFEMKFTDAEREKAKVTTIGGNPTQEEMEQAFEELFKEAWRKNT